MRSKWNFLFLFVITFICIPLLSGCWDSLDIEKRATVLAIAIDKAEPSRGHEVNITHYGKDSFSLDQDMIKLTAQISVPGRIPLGPESGGGVQEPVWVLTSFGHTLDDALLNLQQELADDLFLGHLRMIVISEEIAKGGVERFSDYLRRQPEVRRTAWLAVSKDRAERYMEIAPKLERVPALYLTSMVSNAVDLGKFPNDNIGLFWRSLSSLGQDGFLPYLEIKEAENIQIRGLAYFKGHKMKGMIDPIEIGLLMGVLGEKEGGYGVFINIPDTDDEMLVRAVNRKSRIKTAIKNGKPFITVDIRYESEIEEKENSKIKLDNPDLIRIIEKEANRSTKESIEKLVKKLQKEGSDIFGFGEYIRAKQHSYWKKEVKTKDNWQAIYKDVEVKINVTSHIRRIGIKAE